MEVRTHKPMFDMFVLYLEETFLFADMKLERAACFASAKGEQARPEPAGEAGSGRNVSGFGETQHNDYAGG